LLGLRGYVRVDFRVDQAGQPWILEINANPCLSPDAGFPAAAAQAGLSFEQLVARILADARYDADEDDLRPDADLAPTTQGPGDDA
jgi:D-alanine-D-alanine ligase-like ATP-grasp enzyme